jgi:NAD(P)H-dependent FMN reductase
MALRLHTIVCSTRPGRIGAKIADWFHGVAIGHPRFEAVLVDLAQVNLPMHDEPHHPRLQKYEHAHTKAWSANVAAADAFVWVTPEYNHSPPPALVNALDYVYVEWNYKPVAFVTYGGISGGIRAMQAEKLTALALKMAPIVEAVNLPMAAKMFDASGNFVAQDVHRTTAIQMLDELARWAEALKPLRAPKA